jgi:hypothetical protein
MISLSKFLGAVADVLDTAEGGCALVALGLVASLRKEIPRTKKDRLRRKDNSSQSQHRRLWTHLRCRVEPRGLYLLQMYFPP